ncbi:hypothetical protein MHU86_8335 [Fragilaria crotonensis]|nr:hypothetical protein MHU86_8335 [Fragilaria crotonensis]
MAQIATTRYQAPAGSGEAIHCHPHLRVPGVRERRWNSNAPGVCRNSAADDTGVRRPRTFVAPRATMDLWDQGHFKALVDDAEGEVQSRQPPPVHPTKRRRRVPSTHASSPADFALPCEHSPTAPAAASASLTTSARRQADRSGRCFKRSTLPSATRPLWAIGWGFRALSRSPAPSLCAYTGRRGGDLLTALRRRRPRRHRRRRPRQLASPLRTRVRSAAKEMAAWTNWLANTSPPWAAYRP